MREPRHPEFRYPSPERRLGAHDGMLTLVMWAALVVLLVGLGELALLWWLV
ncbi:MAG: hypothetical protein KGL35_32445 [Bradyrhizobium sp.]|nr:hypothetical protein [Bradyrhizobium sp.]